MLDGLLGQDHVENRNLDRPAQPVFRDRCHPQIKDGRMAAAQEFRMEAMLGRPTGL